MRRYESDVGKLEGYVGQLRSSIGGLGLSIEASSVLENIFKDFDSYIVTRITSEPMRTLGDLKIEDQRIASLLREKDAEILRLKDRIVGIEHTKVVGGIHDAHAKTVAVLNNEILNLKNENAALRGELPSAELVGNYREQIATLNNRVL